MQWPTLEELLGSGKRFIAFLDYGADTSVLSYLLPEFEMVSSHWWSSCILLSLTSTSHIDLGDSLRLDEQHVPLQHKSHRRSSFK